MDKLKNKRIRFLTFENIIIIVFSISLAFGVFNPLFGKTASESSTSLSQIMTVIVIPVLFYRYKGHIIKSLLFINWLRPLFIFYIIGFFISLLLASQVTMGLLVEWIKLLLGILICIFIPVVFKNQYLMNVAMLLYSMSCAFICLLILTGFFDSYNEVHNGRLWLWGENPNSTSTRWVLAIIFIINNVVSNPLKISKLRFFLLPLVLPLITLVMMSGSVGSFVVALVVIALSITTEIRKHPGMAVGLIGLAILAAIFIIGHFDTDSYGIVDRLMDKVNSGEEDIRIRLMRASWQIFLENPFFGTGSFDYLSEMYKHGANNVVHNLYMHILSISGLVGFLPFALFCFFLIKGSLLVIKKNSLAFVLLVYMIFIASKTGGIMTYLFMWFVYGLIISIVNNVFIEEKQIKLKGQTYDGLQNLNKSKHSKF